MKPRSDPAGFLQRWLRPAQWLVAVVAGLGFLAQWHSTDSAPEPDNGGLAGLQSAQPLPDEPQGVWITPSGRRIVRGTVNELGYVMPRDVRRPKPARQPVSPPTRAEIDRRRAAAGPGPFPEQRLGPDDGHTQNETSIAVDGATLVAGWNHFTDTSLVMGVGRSADSGQTWTWELFDGHTLMSDPAVAAAGSERWYFGYLATGGIGGGDAEIYVRRSLDDGVTWQDPVAVTANDTFDDKPYIAARGDEVLVAWADFSFSPARVRAARSLDGGLTFGNDTLLIEAPDGGNGPCPVIAADGTYFVLWRGSAMEFLWQSRSVDQGATWSDAEPIAEMSPLPTPLPGGFRIVNLPAAAGDPVTGDLVVVWHDQLFGNPDILSIRSTDGGATWSAPVRVNDDAGSEAQFFPWLAIDEVGLVHVMWYDRRHNGFDIDVYYATSIDGGVSFEANVRVTAESYTPVLPWETGAADFIGDYNAIAAAAGRAFPFYQDARSGIQDVYVAVLPTLTSVFADGFESGDLTAWSGSAR
ncbi:MAG: sialidase family protein [Acidobacteriota bacterium]